MFKDEYRETFSKVTASQETYRRVMQMTKKTKNVRTGIFSKVLIAAVIVSVLAVTASAAEFDWFVKFFGGSGNLNQEQVQYLENNTQKQPESPKEDSFAIHTDVLQFVKKEVVFQADANNTHVTGEGQPDYQAFRMYSLTLSKTKARLMYYYFEGMDTTKPCSISHLTVVLKTGREIEMPIAVSKRAMDFVSEVPIPLEAVDYVRLPDGVRVKPVNPVEDGYDISLDSVLTDGQTIYLTLNVTLPETMEPPGLGWTMDQRPGFTEMWLCPADQEKPTIEELLLWRNDGGESRILEDGDGKDNTFKLVAGMSRSGSEALLSFSKDWKLHIGGFCTSWHHEANRELAESQYPGQDYLMDGEDVTQFLRFEEICWDTWEFRFSLEEGEESHGEVELVTEPITLYGYRHASIAELQQDPDKDRYGPFDVQLVSLRLSPLSYYLEYTAEDAFNAQAVDVGAYTLVMKDGREVALLQYPGRHNFQEPILLTQISHIRLPNGDILQIPQ